MWRLQKILTRWLKKLFSDSHATIVGIVLGSMFAGGGIYVFAKNLWSLLINTIQSPTPLWATIALIILVAVYVRQQAGKNYQNSYSPQSGRTQYFTVGALKWRITISPDNTFDVEQVPICVKHNLLLVYDDNDSYYSCPEARNNGCENVIHVDDLNIVYHTAVSYIDKATRDKK